MKFRTWLSIVTAFAIILILYFGRHDLVIAWRLLDRVNILILALLIPIQLLSYYSVGGIIFNYLRSKGELKDVSSWSMARVALELNFVNHALPSGGVSGISYLNWRLKHYGVSTSRATMSQVVRYACAFGVYLGLVLIALLIMTIDGHVNKFVVYVSTFIGVTIVFAALFVVYIIGSENRIRGFSHTVSNTVNRFGHKVLRRRKTLLDASKLTTYFDELHEDYVELVRNPRDLKKPLLWALVYNLAEIGLFVVAFLALGQWVDPAPILIAYGLATIAGIFVVTPGGAGAYEALMISFLATAGVGQGTAIAGVLLARIILLMGTVVSGYIFYQLSLLHYGSRPPTKV